MPPSYRDLGVIIHAGDHLENIVDTVIGQGSSVDSRFLNMWNEYRKKLQRQNST